MSSKKKKLENGEGSVMEAGLASSPSEEERANQSAGAKRVILFGVDGLQLCQVQRFVKMGKLPNFKKLLAMGSAGELLPELPAWTPTNWGSIATGALPGSTMLAGWFRRLNDDLDGEWDLSTFSSRACPVETIWEAAEKAGLKTLTIFYPLTWPPKVKKGMVVAPLYSGPGIIPLDISKGRVWSTKPDQMENAEAIKVRRDGDKFVADVEIAPSAIELAKEYNFGDKPEEAREKIKPGRSVYIRIAFDPSNSMAELFSKDGEKICTVKRGEWSDWIVIDFGTRGKGSVRFYLFSCEENSKFGFTLAHSSIYPTDGFTYPEELASELVEKIGPFLTSPIHLPGVEGDKVWLEEHEYQGQWIARVAKYLLETRGWDLCYIHYHIIDGAMHRWLNGADPEGGGYDPSTADYFVEMICKAYEIVDKVLGILMELMDDQTVLIVVSDHGNIPNKWCVDYERVLEAAGLLALDEDRRIIWEKTRAFMIPQRISDVYINLKGKFPKGTVNPEDYERVQEEIIDALLNLSNPDGKRVVAFALKKKDAQIVGYYGPEVGDVVFTFNSFHGRCKLPRGVAVRRATQGANHGPQIATTRTEFSSDLASIIIAGPGIRRGYARDSETRGLWRLIDVVPTIAHILGFKPPRDSRGGVMYDIFDNDE